MKIRIIIVSLLILSFGTVYAGDKQTPFDGMFKAKVTEKGVKFRWAPKDKNLGLTYKLSRHPAGSKEVYKPVIEKKRLSRDEIIKTFGNDFFDSIRSLLFPMEMVDTISEKFAAANMVEEQSGMILFMADLKFPLALSLGLGHETVYSKKDKEDKKTWMYKLEVFDGKKLNGVAYQIVRPGPPPSRPMITGEAVSYDWGNALKWSDYRKFSAFNIYRSEKSNADFKKITETPVYVATQVDEANRIITAPYFYSDSTTKKDKLYYYKVSGVDLFGDESPLSVSIFPIRDRSRRPSPMTPVKLIQIEEEIHISWIASDDKAVEGYNLYRGNAYNSPFAKLNTLPMKKTSYVDPAVQLGNNYFYSVTAVRKNGTESVMSLPRLLAPKDITPPAAPTKLTGTAQLSSLTKKGVIRLTWFPVSDDDLEGYHVFKADRIDALDWARLNGGPVKTPFITDKMDKALDKKPYFYKVQAVDIAGNPSAFSDILEIKQPDVTPPPAPSWKEFQNKEKSIVLRWNPLLVEDLKEYRILRGRGNKQIDIGAVLAEKTSFTDTKVIPGATHRYQLKAIDKAGNESALSPVLTVKAIDKTPPVIKKISATSQKGRVLIKTTITDSDYKAMSIQRKKGDGKDFTTVRSMIPVTQWTDKKVNTGSRYSYRIIAYDVSGNAAVSSVADVIVRP